MPELPPSTADTAVEPTVDPTGGEQQFTVDLLRLSFSDTIFVIERSRDE
ncbi:hypothetical protein [Actinosynnema sp. ALI-1.44]|nr:hypothetical protein [Actinosynnema sp. ALI-1.44]